MLLKDLSLYVNTILERILLLRCLNQSILQLLDNFSCLGNFPLFKPILIPYPLVIVLKLPDRVHISLIGLA